MTFAEGLQGRACSPFRLLGPRSAAERLAPFGDIRANSGKPTAAFRDRSEPKRANPTDEGD